MRYDNLGQMIEDRARRFGDFPALVMYGSTEAFTYRQLRNAAAGFAAELAAAGLAAGDRVAILSDSRPRWGVAFFGTLYADGVVLPLDPGAGDDELACQVRDAAPAVLVVSREYKSRARTLAHGMSLRILRLEEAGETAGRAGGERACARGPQDPALLTYTSGTMGSAKGVVTTHANLLFQLESCRRLFGNDESCRTVSILPLSHLYEITTGFLGVLYGGGRVCYCNSLLPADILGAMAEQRITCMLTVPLFLNLLERAVRNEIARLPNARRRGFLLALKLSALLTPAMRRSLFRKLHRRFGGCCEYFICGGAPLDARTLTFFRRIGLPVYQGYGMAEASPVIATNAPGANRCGSVGRPLPGIELRIDGDSAGEILTRGPHVMHGYYGESPRGVDDEGWLPTGDIGYLDADGYLYVSGRKKNVIVLGSGKKVHPEAIESVLFADADIEEGCVVAATARRGMLDGSEEVCAIIVPAGDAVARLGGGEALCRHLRSVVVERSRLLPAWQRPTRFLVRTEPLPRTATRKLCRPQVSRWAAGEALSC